MKLFIVAALIAVSSAGRLEHLERSYLPPDSNSLSSSGSGFGSNSGGFGVHSSGFGGQTSGFGGHSSGFAGSAAGVFGSGSNSGPSNGFGANGAPGSFGSNNFGAGSRGSALNAGGFAGATSNQYLPPNQGPAGAGTPGQNAFGSTSSGIGGRVPQTYIPPNKYLPPSTLYGTPQLASPNYNGGQPGNQAGAPSPVNSQYLPPKSNYPQQKFDEQTGYHY
ncbi:hypothetical protein K1T71_010468 [Dendrolimus kikuchii]|uniref:Uncharacterized protein n=1 Tax=Dendrolimus kikuchii TaxID=765133 RepID=A0ACC1CSR2_9NEOP|nr:hypothetical protein K1T71_010468 [Dendrolimus kikuchii]